MLSSSRNVPYICLYKGWIPVNCNKCKIRKSDVNLDMTEICIDCPETVEFCPVCNTARKMIIRTLKVGCPSCYQVYRKEIRILRELPGKINELVRN